MFQGGVIKAVQTIKIQGADHQYEAKRWTECEYARRTVLFQAWVKTSEGCGNKGALSLNRFKCQVCAWWGQD